jgi:hypothetical protein
MKLPMLTAERALGPPTAVYRGTGALRHPAASVRPQATQACLAAVVGSNTAAVCSARCGGDLNCWRDCAELSDTTAIAACFRS